VATLVQVEVGKNFLQELGIVLAEFKSSKSDFFDQVLDSLLSSGSVSIFWHLPARLHHANKVLVTWGTHRQVSVVVEKLFGCDDAVIVSSGAFKVA